MYIHACTCSCSCLAVTCRLLEFGTCHPPYLNTLRFWSETKNADYNVCAPDYSVSPPTVPSLMHSLLALYLYIQYMYMYQFKLLHAHVYNVACMYMYATCKF